MEHNLDYGAIQYRDYISKKLYKNIYNQMISKNALFWDVKTRA